MKQAKAFHVMEMTVQGDDGPAWYWTVDRKNFFGPFETEEEAAADAFEAHGDDNPTVEEGGEVGRLQ
jgi:hypothetical protein